MRSVGVDELRQEREEEEGDLRVERIHEDALYEDAPKANVHRAGGRLAAVTCEERPEPEADHAFSSQTRRSPSRVRKGSTRSIVRECGATRSASPPVAIASASAPSSSRMRPTMPST